MEKKTKRFWKSDSLKNLVVEKWYKYTVSGFDSISILEHFSTVKFDSIQHLSNKSVFEGGL